MPFFSKVFKKNNDPTRAKVRSKKHTEQESAAPVVPLKPRWADAWSRKDVEPEEVQELLRGCTFELKSRGLDIPFLLLPFRPTSDPSAARTFIRNYFDPDKGSFLTGGRLSQELMLTEPMVLGSVMKWCWSRLPGGVVTWEAYELFRIGEQDSDMARDAFATFIPISVESDARTKIIFDFFDLMSGIAAHGKTNGMAGRKLSRLAGWWAFGQIESGNGFDGGYKSWTSAADATSHLFFAYLRSLSPDSVRGTNGISALPISLQNLVEATEYPPMQPSTNATSKVVMIVDSVSPTPFALLRRAKHFEYRDDDQALQQFSDYEDPVQALTDECRRVLKSISSINQSTISTSKASTGLPDASWSRFEDIGFGGIGDYSDNEDEVDGSAFGKKQQKSPHGMRSAPHSKTHDHGRPTTPSWADFLSSGFIDETSSPGPAPLLLPLDKQLPPLIESKRGHSSHSHGRQEDSDLEPGELASINAINIEDAFWWVWISSLAGEEPTDRKGVFGRCALIETSIRGSTWLVIEEMVKGAAPEPEVGAYIAEKKSRFGFSKKSRLQRSMTKRVPSAPKVEPYSPNTQISPLSKTSIGPDQHARIQAAAAALQQKQKQADDENAVSPRRARHQDAASTKTNSVFTLQPVIMSEAASAMQWANKYDKSAIRAAYLGNNFAGKGSTTDLGTNGVTSTTNGSITPVPKDMPRSDSYNFPKQDGLPRNESNVAQERDLPALPPETPKEQSQLNLNGQQFIQPPPLPENTAPPLPSMTAMHPSDRAVKEASEVPLPTATNDYIQTEGPTSPRENELTKTPTRDPPANGLSPTSTPDSKKPNKLRKTQRGSFKGFFNKKPVPASPQKPVDSLAAAAARAAYPGPSMKPNYISSETSLGRRFSRSKRSLVASPPPVPDLPVTQEESSSANLGSSDMQYDPPQDYGQSQANLGRFDTDGQANTNQEFDNANREFDNANQKFDNANQKFDNTNQNFDNTNQNFNNIDQGDSHVEPQQTGYSFNQGPMTDEPAFVPEESPERRSTPARDQSEISSLSDDEPAISPPTKDRWAQIRKNAAERAAARQSEEQSSRQSQAKETDDGESDNAEEETIESRVARIKARVAELTGQNMASSSSPNRPT